MTINYKHGFQNHDKMTDFLMWSVRIRHFVRERKGEGLGGNMEVTMPSNPVFNVFILQSLKDSLPMIPQTLPQYCTI